MHNKLKKACSFLNRTADDYKFYRRFSGYYAYLRVCSRLSDRAGMKHLSSTFWKKRHAWVTEYLAHTLQPVLDQFADDQNPGSYQENAPIWVCWWTGEDSAPPLVTKCIHSIRKNAGSHPVHLITKDNYRQYLDIPAHILNKVNDKTMCLANFSDYIRFSLLAQYGGLWLDATIYCAAPIPESIFRMPVFSCKGGNRSVQYISDYRWTSFCYGGFKGNILFRYMQTAFDAYWCQTDIAVDYLLVDYLINLGYSHIDQIRLHMDQIPENNLRRDDLQAAMNAALPADQFDSILDPDTVLYKLSWRESYSLQTPQGSDSVYAYFLNHN